MAKSCKGLAMELVKCLSETDCVKVQKMPYKECAGEKVPNITSECVGLRRPTSTARGGRLTCEPGYVETRDTSSVLAISSFSFGL
ncbi:unnamed protein product [Urochloa humidicola]